MIEGTRIIRTSEASARFQALGTVKVRQHRPVPGTVKALQLTREHRCWYVIVVAETEPMPLPPAGREVGVDMGVARFLTTSDGEVVANPRFLTSSAEVIADLERRKARASPGSGNRKRIRRALAGEWRKVRNRRRRLENAIAFLGKQDPVPAIRADMQAALDRVTAELEDRKRLASA